MKTALITGANKGIGHEVARELAAKGFHVFVGARNAKAGRKAAEEIAKKSGKATFLEIDVAGNGSVRKAAREFSSIEDHLDVLVNNAGIIVDGDNAILEINDDLFGKTLETNTLGALRVIRVFERWRSIDRWRRWLVAGLLHFQDCAEWRNCAGRSGVAEVRREFGVPWLGANGNGRRKRKPFSGGRRRHDCMASQRVAA